MCTLFFSRLSLEVHLFDYGKTGHFWVDGYEYLRQIEFRIAILRDKLEYLGEAFCTEKEMRLASLANFPPLNFCCYPAVPDQYLVPSCPWWEATEEAITEMKKLAISGTCLCVYKSGFYMFYGCIIGKITGNCCM